MTGLLPGFADPVTDAQACFRAVLDAIARPGRVLRIGAAPAAPPPLDRATAAVLLTLVDAEVSLAVDADGEPATDWIRFHCGARLVAAAAADFVLALALPALDRLAAGSHEGPEASATVILQVAALGSGRALRLAGPGLAAPATLAVDGLPADFPARWAANHALFPRGVDLILCAGDALAALPRSVRVAAG